MGCHWFRNACVVCIEILVCSVSYDLCNDPCVMVILLIPFFFYYISWLNLLLPTQQLVHLFEMFPFVLLVMGSIKWPLSSLKIYGLLKADGQSHSGSVINNNGTLMGGLGGGSGGTILLFLQALTLEKNSSLSVAGGHGGPVGGGGGGGGRVHFDWSNIATGDEYVQIATVNGTIMSRYLSFK